MIIVSQDKDKILNYNNITQIYIGYAENNKKRSIRCETLTGTHAALGTYETEERAKEVLEEITNMYKATESFTAAANRVSDNVGALVMKKGFAYYMPLQ